MEGHAHQGRARARVNSTARSSPAAVTSDRKISTNRANAKKSTGPRTKVGRQTSARNAFRHGLAVAVSTQSCFSKDIEVLARSLVGKGKPVTDFARAIAETEIDLRRIRKMRALHLAPIIGSPDAPLAAYARLTQDFRTLERYERRANSRRKRALTALMSSKNS